MSGHQHGKARTRNEAQRTIVVPSLKNLNNIN
jgi:hypothetical protein